MKKPKYNYIDAHSHSVNFLQQPKGLKETLKWVDKTNISQSVIASLALINKDDKYFYLPDTDSTLAKEYNTLDQSEKSRFLPLICGFDPADSKAGEKIERTIKYYPNIWHGIGEILFRHDELSREIKGEHPRLNNPAMKNVYRLCAKRKMPIEKTQTRF